MTNDNYLDDVLASAEGPHIGALFDFDGTIIAGYSVTAMMREKLRRREMGVEEIVETANVVAQYSNKSIGFSGLMLGAAKFMKGVSEESYFEFGEELYERHIAKKVYPESRALIDAHLAKGHTVAIVSSATIYQIEATARDLGIEHVCCSRYEVKNGEFTGEVMRPLCFGEGKVLAAEKLAKQTGIDLDKSFFYSDSDDDIELLERVGKPHVLNPNKRLEAIAAERNWPMNKFTSRGQASAMDYTRTVYAFGTLIGAFAAAVPIWALTGSQREAMNFSMGLFGDVASALAGIKLDVSGEENLWNARPCIFLFNHQSKADMMILTKLIRKDMGGVSKKELRDIPLLGTLMELSGTVFVDRANAASAIKAMEPLVDAMNVEGKSIVISPEGTRTPSPKLAQFKKGPFHMAIQAGVPIVPIVIHNAGDVSPKNEFVMRPATVKVDVLPAVDTSGWSAETINDHVREVRGMFLKALGQKEEESPLEVLKNSADCKSSRESANSVSPRKKPRKIARKKKPVGRTSVKAKTIAKPRSQMKTGMGPAATKNRK